MTTSLVDHDFRAQGAFILGRDYQHLHLVEQAFREVGWSILSAASSAGLQERLSNQPPAVILIARQLPEGPGIDVCRSIRKENPAVALVMIVNSPEEGALARQAGADDFVIIPLDFAEMVTRTEARVIVRRGRFVELKPSSDDGQPEISRTPNGR